ncbi:uncharacterized protein CXQ87_001425 [Candidozyma duobushaemuli]|uniref:DNA polymerase delta small subunit n=2 Tax=Candidozyma TaxID=3303203 RepID=A0ABX8I221_9ASCO|nr:uncharacterized protein CXQ87_001425 [[Candida] duobushaemulonis]PVH18495.1 hypothetical protein CXQ87_001425 [[Candida] duobushaemulonis]QWU87022.1 hypothetical protein CA3LBN_001240 [[Candida] haemuloni]
MNESLVEGTTERVADNFKESFEKNDEFNLSSKPRNYSRQFFSMYQHRLSVLKPRVDSVAMEKWGHNTRRVDGQKIQRKDRILDIAGGELCWVSGTVFTEMKNKLDIFKDVEHGTDDVMPKTPASYIGNEASIVMLEDESGRAILHNENLLANSRVVSGVIVAVLGIEIQAGIFEAMEIIYPTPAPQKPLSTSSDSDSYIALVSGLKFQKETDCDLKTVLLQQWLCGEAGSAEDFALASKVSRVILAGNSLEEFEEDTERAKDDFGSKNTSHFKAESLVLFNAWLSSIVASIPVTIMAGPKDPAEICMPQQALHRSLLGINAKYTGVSATDPVQNVTNPAWMEMENGLRILGSAGQNITDITKYYPPESEIAPSELMSKTLLWQHVAPTAPDTLYCYPYDDADPFALEETPHLYFAGNQSEFGSRKVQLGEFESTVVSIPEFAETGQMVLVNTSTLEVKVIEFGV